MTTVVAHTSSNGRKPSTTQQAYGSIAQSRHDFGTIICMDGASIFSHGHIFDVMQAIFDRPMSSLEFEQTLGDRSEEHTSELQSLAYLVCRLLLEKKKLQ